jgi:hypothetical protein
MTGTIGIAWSRVRIVAGDYSGYASDSRNPPESELFVCASCSPPSAVWPLFQHWLSCNYSGCTILR